ncbi:hypothetical protein PR202_ga16356 [Eleusine coracana subsp. coracana]|uniref:Inositol-tetrakisphosphate 1-kinase 6 n=1 Tax=Eleusine coracana subsp. coracana TaxID=191504 RepID=A0AAV5CMB9_ELECO|nr:hypothetical protein PR202_ga16356 [Eleusine coracana subsp. coracana]
MAMEGRPVRLVLDSSVLLEPSASADGGGGSGEVALAPGAEALLRRLRYSNLGVAICYPEGFLERIASLYSFGYSPLPATSGNCSPNDLMLEWSRTSSCFYVTSSIDQSLFSELRNQDWRVLSVDPRELIFFSGPGNDCGELIKDPEVFKVSRLQELLLTLATLIKREIGSSSVLVVGYLMKQSREEDYAKAKVDMVLHKVTDEIVKIDPNSSFEFPKGISFSAGMSEIIRPSLNRFVEEHPDFCIIDPFRNIYPLLDRHQIQQILVQLQECGTEGKPRLRAPHSLKVNNFHDGKLEKQLAEAKLSFPLIVKPQVACGVADAHNMALVFKFEEFSNLTVPLPAVLQEYIDHGSKIFKFYVIGDKVFYAVKTSMPNASFLKSSSGGEPLTFNSLKTLPVATKEQLLETRVQDSKLDTTLVEEAAKSLKELLGLTIFGFDVVVQEGTGDHVIVDLNYLPSFKEVPDTEAVPAFWDAIRLTYQSKIGKSHT